ncbi:MAG TPA: chorismate mutase [Acetobacteraceae bacterium]|nr:chorismate mutase [Acetobacteraceae bacterium]
MSSTIEQDAPSSPSQTPPSPQAELLALRAELDRLDDTLHDTLMRRAAVVARVAVASAKGSIKLRPGREAAILRRLIARHAGAMPAQTVVRIWREVLAGSTAMQGPFSVAVCDHAAGQELVACAREHFGALAPLRVLTTPAQALAEVSAGNATIAVLPLPAEQEPEAAAWWTTLLRRDTPIRVIARLPIWAPRPDGAPRAEALVVAAVSPDPSGEDRSLIGLEASPELSRARLGELVAAAGFAAGTILLRRDPGLDTARALVEVNGFVTETDPRLAALDLAHPPVVIGAYAVPLMEETR